MVKRAFTLPIKVEQDAKEMGEKIFGVKPTFEEMIETLAAVELQINGSHLGDSQ